MRIGFFGKGGAGKSTFAAAMVKYAQQQFPEKTIVAMDGDINMHLGMYLGISPVTMLHPLRKEIGDYVFGERDDIQRKHFIASTPPHHKSQFIRTAKDDQFVQKFADFDDNVALFSVGTFGEKDIGQSCYHSKLNAFDYIYNHLLDGKDDIVISDCMAGIDNLGTTNYFVHDLSIFVVEPTIQSIQVFKDYYNAVKKEGIHYKVIVNKIQDDQDKSFVFQYLAEEDIIGFVGMSPFLRSFNQGDQSGLGNFVDNHKDIFEKVYGLGQSLQRDRNDYLLKLNKVHVAMCDDWYNAYHNTILYDHHDKSFSYMSKVEGV